MILLFDPGAPRKLLTGTRVALVSGTNGKTTTTHLLAAAARASVVPGNGRLVHNADGANLLPGIVSALSEEPNAKLAVLETDERVVAAMIRLARPEVVVLLNLSRDQLDRNHEISSLARSWRTALQLAGAEGPTVVANASDPLIVWAAEVAKTVVWVDTGSRWTADSALCPRCSSSVVRVRAGDADSTRWRCSRCRFAQPQAEMEVPGDGTIEIGADSLRPELQLPGSFNVANAACALAAATILGAPVQSSIEAMGAVQAPAGRFSTISIGSTVARLILAKNPAGWTEALALVEATTVILVIDSAAADGRDVSWLWDVDFEQLSGRRVIATGTRAQDLGVRLSHAAVMHTVVPTLTRALAGHSQPVDVIATYTPFQQLRIWGGHR
jgi:UDP-N-acetylmuramyl tripeptide synthase